ncbi:MULTISPECIES: spore coat protein [Paenibacillus]|uniref:Spore coat protein f yrad n=1 Tax=Paenibacillus illinoisensis TaxID=59845 RepID=A0A2W0CB14_9BACL|nr:MULTISPECIES: spore coat protein [Paenibacillus]PAD33059.1 spore coat protein [Paenibacillus sp. 7523-1]PYY29890.1 Spore coat protein f yrad [Paenibacillus illinoisensis]
MNPILERMSGLHTLTDDVIAMDLLINAKSGVRNYAMAVTECATPEIKQILMKQLDEAIVSHEKISNYMVQQGLYHPYHISEQIQLDLKNIQTAMNILP